MEIIIDSREQKPLTFTGHKTITRKLHEGDYNIQELIPAIVIERKSLPDLYQTITTGHERFKKEILRSTGRTFYIFIEGTLEEFYSKRWSDRPLKIKSDTLKKIIETMVKKYNLLIIECKDRDEMSEKITTELKTWWTQTKQ